MKGMFINMSTIRIVTIICWIVTALALAGLVIWFLFGSAFGAWSDGMGNWSIGFGGTENLTGPYESQGAYSADATGLHSVRIRWVSGEVTVIPHDGNEIQITEFAQRELRDSERLRMSTSGGTLTIRFTEQRSIGRMPQKRLEVLVPRDLIKSLNMLDIDTVSGGVNIKDSGAARININSISGAVDLANMNSQFIDISTTSGDLTAASVRADKLDASSVSGSMQISDAIIATLDVSATSGRTTATGEFDRIDVSTVSGDITVTSATVPNRVNISAVSGGTDIYIPNQGEITVSHTAVSGRFTSDLPVIIQSNAAYSFSSVSGNTRIHALG